MPPPSKVGAASVAEVMRNTWIAYVATAVVAVGAGVAIAGLPSSVENDLVIADVPATSSTVAATVPPTDATSATTTTTVASTTTTTVVEPPEPTTPVTTEPEPEEPDVLVERGELVLGVANGANVAGLAGDTAAQLVASGYVSVSAVNTALVDTSTVYFAPGLEGEAARLAADLGIDPAAIAPIEAARPIVPETLVQLLVVLGRDRA
jgi:hypothetical protein